MYNLYVSTIFIKYMYKIYIHIKFDVKNNSCDVEIYTKKE